MSRQSRAFYLHDGGVQRNRSVERGTRADHTVASEHAGFDKLPAGETDDKRDDAGLGKVHTLDGILGLIKERALRHVQRLHVRPEQVGIARRQSRYEFDSSGMGARSFGPEAGERAMSLSHRCPYAGDRR